MFPSLHFFTLAINGNHRISKRCKFWKYINEIKFIKFFFENSCNLKFGQDCFCIPWPWSAQLSNFLFYMLLLFLRTPFLTLHGENDRLCNPLGSDLLYRLVSLDQFFSRDTFFTHFTEGALRRTSLSRYFQELVTNYSWSFLRWEERLSWIWPHGLSRGCELKSIQYN